MVHIYAVHQVYICNLQLIVSSFDSFKILKIIQIFNASCQTSKVNLSLYAKDKVPMRLALFLFQYQVQSTFYTRLEMDIKIQLYSFVDKKIFEYFEIRRIYLVINFTL